MKENAQIEKEVHQLFNLSLLLKSIHALIEIIGGLALLLINKVDIVNFVNYFIQDEISEEPNNRFLNYISQLAAHFTGSSKAFAVLYLITHGSINAFIVVALWKEKIWAYPVSLVILSIFGAYQMYQYSFNHSLLLLGLTILDVIVIILVWHEYGIVKNKYSI